MKEDIKNNLEGLLFGTMEGIVMTLGVILGLNSVTPSKFIIVAGALAAGISDAFANASGFHVVEESQNEHTKKEIYISTFLTFISTLTVNIVILIPILVLPLSSAVTLSFILGSLLLITLGYFVGRSTKENRFKIALEYLLIGIMVAVICSFIGQLTSRLGI